MIPDKRESRQAKNYSRLFSPLADFHDGVRMRMKVGASQQKNPEVLGLSFPENELMRGIPDVHMYLGLLVTSY